MRNYINRETGSCDSDTVDAGDEGKMYGKEPRAPSPQIMNRKLPRKKEKKIRGSSAGKKDWRRRKIVT